MQTENANEPPQIDGKVSGRKGRGMAAFAQVYEMREWQEGGGKANGDNLATEQDDFRGS